MIKLYYIFPSNSNLESQPIKRKAKQKQQENRESTTDGYEYEYESEMKIEIVSQKRSWKNKKQIRNLYLYAY